MTARHRPALPPRNPPKRAPGKTREQKIYEYWQSIRRHSFWWNGDSMGHSPLMDVAAKYKTPIRELRVIIAVEKEKRNSA